MKTQILPLRRVLTSTTLKKELFSKTIAIATKNEIRVVDLDNILYLKSDSNYTEIHLENGIKIVTSTTLKKYEAKLHTQHFIRVHNSYIINRSHLSSYLHKESIIILRNTQKIPVSRSKKEALLNYLKTLMV